MITKYLSITTCNNTCQYITGNNGDSMISFADQIIKRKKIILIVSFIVLILAISGLQTLVFSPGVSGESLPSDMDVIEDDNIIEKEFVSGDQTLAIVRITDISEGITDIRDPRVFEAVRRFTKELQEHENVNNVKSYTKIINEYSKGRKLSENQFKSVIQSSPEIRNLMNSEYTSTIIKIETDVESKRTSIYKFMEELEDTIENSGFPDGVEASYTGSVPMDYKTIELLQSDMKIMVLLASILVLGSLLYFYRDLVRSFVPLVPLLFSVILTVGVLSIIGMQINPATVAVAAMLIGMGIDYGVHVFNRYYEERQKGKGLEDSAKISIGKVGKAIVGTSATTIAGFASLYISRIGFMKDLSISLVLGILIALISALTLLPIVIIYEEKIRKKITGKYKKPNIAVHKGNVKKLFIKISNLTENYYKGIIVFFIISTIIMGYGGSKIIMQAGTEDILPEDSKVVQNFDIIESQYRASDAGNILIKATDGRDVRNPDLLEDSRAIQELLLADSHNTKVDKIDSFTSLIDEIPDEESKIKDLIRKNPKYREYFNEDYTVVKIDIQGTFAGNQKEMDENIGSIKRNIKAVSLPAGYEASLTGSTPINHKIIQVAGEDMGIMSLLGSLGILIIILLLFRSITDSIIMGSPMVVGALWTFGFVGYMGIEINQFLIGFLSIILGLAIDFGMHITHRYREAKQIQETLTSVGPGILMGGLTTIFSYTALSMASLPMIRNLGKILMFGILASMFAAFLLAPSLIKFRENFLGGKKDETKKSKK